MTRTAAHRVLKVSQAHPIGGDSRWEGKTLVAP